MSAFVCSVITDIYHLHLIYIIYVIISSNCAVGHDMFCTCVIQVESLYKPLLKKRLSSSIRQCSYTSNERSPWDADSKGHEKSFDTGENLAFCIYLHSHACLRC